ncbi:MAG TPA: hypothetical protein VGR73_17405 [Bryobacteraceae bacterium]|nr:hypothetical protein [Bryobacteraceae bacterium]
MPNQNYMLADGYAILAGFGLFSLLTILPGYALGWWLDVARFRQRTLPFRLAMSVPLAIALGPVLSFLLGSWLSLGAVWAMYGILCLSALALFARERRVLSQGHLKVLGPFLGLISIWIALGMLMLGDIQTGRRVYFPIMAFDYAVRIPFTASIGTWGLPAQTPLFFPGHAVALRYHYYWLILCALVRQAGGSLVSARQAVIAGTLWSGIGLICLVPLYLRLFSSRAAADIARRSILGIALLGVTGLDILPALLMIWLNRVGLVNGISPSVEWWNNQVGGWMYTTLWDPHYIASLIACLTGFLILWEAPRAEGTPRKVGAGIAAGLAFATAAGSGIYVAFVFAIFLAVWTLITIAKKWYGETALLAVAGAAAAVSSIPFLARLRSPGAGGSFAQFTFRSFDLAQLLLIWLGLDRPWQIVLANVVSLPLNYFLELGFFLAAGLLVWRRFREENRSPTRQEGAAFAMVATSVVVCTFLKSSVITNNDLGWRGFLIAQFVLLLWAADLLAAPAAIPRGDRAVLMAMLWLGAAGVVYDLAIGRFYPLLSDAQRAPKISWLAQDEKLGWRTYANRAAYDWLRAHTSDRAFIQNNPNVAVQDTFYGIYADRRTLAEDATCSAAFGGDPHECPALVERLDGLFAGRGQETLESLCRSLPIDIVVAKDTDPAWSDPSSWIWRHPPLFANDFVRLFGCSRAR